MHGQRRGVLTSSGAGPMAWGGGVLSLATRGRIRTPPKPCLGDLGQGLAVAMGSFPLAPGGPAQMPGERHPRMYPPLAPALPPFSH